MEYEKIAVLAGVTDGIGKHFALGLSKTNYRLIFIARNKEKADKIVKEIKAINPTISVQYLLGDMQLIRDTIRIANEIKKLTNSIDLLYQSTAIVPNGVLFTNEGVEKTFAVNFLTRYVLTNELLPLILNSEDKKIITIANAGRNKAYSFDDIFDKSKTNLSTLYMQLRFQEANDIYAVELSENYSKQGLKNFCIFPGLVNTGLHKQFPWFIRFFLTKIMGTFIMVEPQQVAKIPLTLVLEKSKTTQVLIDNKGQAVKIPERLNDSQYRNKLFNIINSFIEQLLTK